jgi:hypothetical protein
VVKQLRNELVKWFGLIVGVLIVIGAAVLAIYTLLGALTDGGRHWLATGLVFAVPLAYALGLQVAKSHRAGLEKGVALKLTARERTAAIKPASVATAQRAQWDDLLPRQGAAIVRRRGSDSDVLDL